MPLPVYTCGQTEVSSNTQSGKYSNVCTEIISQCLLKCNYTPWKQMTEMLLNYRINNPGELSSNRACAVFNGTTITVTSCGLQQDNGVLCMAPFGVYVCLFQVSWSCLENFTLPKIRIIVYCSTCLVDLIAIITCIKGVGDMYF